MFTGSPAYAPSKTIFQSEQSLPQKRTATAKVNRFHSPILAHLFIDCKGCFEYFYSFYGALRRFQSKKQPFFKKAAFSLPGRSGGGERPPRNHSVSGLFLQRHLKFSVSFSAPEPRRRQPPSKPAHRLPPWTRRSPGWAEWGSSPKAWRKAPSDWSARSDQWDPPAP